MMFRNKSHEIATTYVFKSLVITLVVMVIGLARPSRIDAQDLADGHWDYLGRQSLENSEPPERIAGLSEFVGKWTVDTAQSGQPHTAWLGWVLDYHFGLAVYQIQSPVDDPNLTSGLEIIGWDAAASEIVRWQFRNPRQEVKQTWGDRIFPARLESEHEAAILPGLASFTGEAVPRMLQRLIGRWTTDGQGLWNVEAYVRPLPSKVDGGVIANVSLQHEDEGDAHEFIMVIYPSGDALQCMVFDNHGSVLQSEWKRVIEGDRIVIETDLTGATNDGEEYVARTRMIRMGPNGIQLAISGVEVGGRYHPDETLTLQPAGAN